MAITNLIAHRTGRMQFQGVFDTVVVLEADWNPDAVLSNGFIDETITVPGAQLGDMVFVSFGADLQSLVFVAHVDAVDSVSLHLNNPTAGTVNLAEAPIHVIILRPLHHHGH